MKTKILYTATLCGMLLLSVTANAQPCYYEGDPVLTPSGFDVPKSSSDNDCYYGGDPVMDMSGNYDNPLTMAEGSYYYYADLQETVSSVLETQDESEFSAFEHEAITPVISQLETTDKPISNTSYDSDHSWTPAEWDGTY